MRSDEQRPPNIPKSRGVKLYGIKSKITQHTQVPGSKIIGYIKQSPLNMLKCHE